MRTKFLPLAACLLALAAPLSHAQVPNLKDINMRDSALIERWSQVFDAVWPLQVANAELCPEQRASLPGYMAMGVDDGTGVRVLQVAAQSPAEAAGLREGDFILAINGDPTNHKKAAKAGEQYEAAYNKAVKRNGPMELQIDRGGAVQALTIASIPACDFRVIYTGQPLPTMVQDSMVVVGTTMDQFAANPEQLRMYLARDFARTLLNHREQRAKTASGYDRMSTVANVLSGGRLRGPSGLAIANWKQGPQQDLEADRYGLYLVARTGDDVRHAPAYWQGVFAHKQGNAVVSRLLNTSRGSPERLKGIEEATAEILALQDANKPLIP